MRADSCSGPTTDSICGHGLGRMGHSSNFARWPHLGPIPPMDGGGHLVPLSYVYGYRGGVGRRGVAEATIGDNELEIRARVRRYQISSFYRAAQRVSCPNRPFPRSADRVNGKTADLVEIFSPQRDAPGRSQVAYQVVGANSGPLKSCFYSLVGLGGS